jgi:hypothetical protein
MNTTYHKKEVTIAGETITVEYFETNFNSEISNKISDLWYDITLPFYKLKRKTKDIYWDIRKGIQRMKNGYDDIDRYCLYGRFIDRYTNVLKDYKKNMHGHPARFSEEEWNAIIDKMLLHLYYMDEDNVDEELCKDVPENWIPRWDTTYPIMEHHKNEFFKLFSEHFYDLWD